MRAGQTERTHGDWYDTTNQPNCWICGRSVSVGDSKIDENGSAVHEICGVAKLALEEGQSQRSELAKVILKES